MSGMVDSERNFKKRLKNLLMKDEFYTYAELLSPMAVHLTDFIPTAAVDLDGETIYFNRKYASPSYDPDDLSLTIRHEILHVVLEHAKRALKQAAVKAGLDYHKLTQKDLDELTVLAHRKSNKPEYGNPSHTNFAGDWDLSKYYLEKDKELQKKLGGLVLEYDHPEWRNLSFEDITNRFGEVDDESRMNTSKVIEGEFVDGKFVTKSGKTLKGRLASWEK